MAAEAAESLLTLVATIVALGVGAQVLSDRFQVPSVLFLILAGVVLGPVAGLIGRLLFGSAGGGLIDVDTFGDALPAIVGLAVAVIVFEGAFHLKIDRLREAPAASLRLVTVGAAVSFLGTALAVRLAIGASWGISLLVGALLVATGPTVITPVMDVVPVRDRVSAVLETEGIVNDVTAAILAVVVFESLTVENPMLAVSVQGFVARLGVGVVVGLFVAAVVWYLLDRVDLSPGNAPQNARLLVLAGAIVAFAAADALAEEAGIAAVATAGVLLGNADLPYEAEIESFKGDVTLVVLSFVFIALAGLLHFEDFLGLGLGGLAVVLAVALLVRPALVFLSTVGARFTVEEKLFISFVGPRGIIPASVATLFAIRLAETDPRGASVLVGTVFLVIFATVVFEAGLARHIAEFLDVIPLRVLVIGGGTVGRALAERLEARGENVVVVEESPDVVEIARNAGFRVVSGDAADSDVLREAGAENAKIVVVATGDDDVNLLVAQLASSKFGVETVIARANDPDNVDAFEDLGVRTISSTDATAWAIDNAIERPALAAWMTQLGREGDVQEVEVTARDLIGRPIREVGPELPQPCLIALVSRDGEATVPDADFVVQEGDHLTLLGRREAVREAMAQVHPRE